MNKKRESRILLLVLLAMIFTLSPAGSASSQDDDSGLDPEGVWESMTTKERVGQLFMISWSGTTPQATVAELLKEYHVGSVYISGRNFGNALDPTAAEQVAGLTSDLQRVSWEGQGGSEGDQDRFFLPLFLAVDHEGDGPRLTRIRSGMTLIPSPLAFGATWKPEHARNVGEIVGSELSAIGINMLLGPVIDVMDDPSNNERGNLDTRVFGGDFHWVGDFGRAFIQGVHCGSDGKMVTVAKHYPGHGDSNRATDNEVAVTDKPTSELLSADLVPFIRVAEDLDEPCSGMSEAMMSSHIAIQDTGTRPITLYRDEDVGDFGLGGITKLMQEDEILTTWYEKGFIVTDNLGVGALGGEFYRYSANQEEQVALDALIAGNDLLILHDFIHAPDGKAGINSTVFHQKVMDIIDYFVEQYEDDEFIRQRIDEASKKIVDAKLESYPEPTLQEALPSALIGETFFVPAEDNKTEKEKIIEDLAKDAIALIKPASVDELPGLKPDDTILFFVHNTGTYECESCSDSWRLLRRDFFENYLREDTEFANRANISSYYYLREEGEEGAEGEEGIAFSQFMHGHYKESGESWDEIPDTEREIFDKKLRSADWIIFAFVTGDCGPDIYNPDLENATLYGKCERGEKESDALLQFVKYYRNSVNPWLKEDAKVVAISFGAPPWILDSTHMSKIDVYIGAFNQLVPFQEQALRVLLRKFNPSGASPIDVVATNYDLENQLMPDEAQEITLFIDNQTDHDLWQQGDIVDLTSSPIVDHNGNPVFTETKWTAFSGGQSIDPLFASNRLADGIAKASFELTEPGPANFMLDIEGIDTIEIEIEEVLALNTPSPTPPPTMESDQAPATEVISTMAVLSTPTEPVETIHTPVPATAIITVVATPTADPGEGTGGPIDWDTWAPVIIALFLGLPTALLGYKTFFTGKNGENTEV